MHWIEEIVNVNGYVVTLRFNTGETRVVDLEQCLRDWVKQPGDAFSELLKPDFFSRVQLEPEMGSLKWPNGIDLCPDVLFEMGEPSQVSTAA